MVAWQCFLRCCVLDQGALLIRPQLLCLCVVNPVIPGMPRLALVAIRGKPFRCLAEDPFMEMLHRCG